MFHHEKQLFHPVGVERPNPQYAALLQEQLGGGNGELKAAMQYLSQSFRIRDGRIKDLFLDIAAEELSHMEMVAQTISLLNGDHLEARKVEAGEIETHVLLGLNPGLINASGYSWTADYVTVTGDLCADLLSNIASEQRAKVVYEYLYRQIEDKRGLATSGGPPRPPGAHKRPQGPPETVVPAFARLQPAVRGDIDKSLTSRSGLAILEGAEPKS